MNQKRIRLCGADIGAFTVVLPETPTPTEETAASELVSHIETAAGVRLPVVHTPAAPAHGIYVGTAAQGDRGGIRHDGYVIRTDESNLHLFGRIDRGTLYAVYRFLEKHIGFRKYEPGVGRLLPFDVDVPKHFTDASNPVFSNRFTNWASHVTDTAYTAWSAIHYAGKDVDKYGGCERDTSFCHSFESLCDPRIYFNEHPEYYSLWEGKRIPAGNVHDGTQVGQLCLTNPDVLKIVIENVRKQLAANPSATIVEVSQNDNNRYCQCEKCAAVDAEEGSPSGTLLRFVNAIAEDIEKDYPHVLVRTFAYTYTRKPPKITRPRRNVIIRYCTIEACFRHGLDDPTCAKNAGKFKEELLEWGRICDKISIWDYTRNFSCYFAPTPNFEILRDNARFFADNHALHVFEQDTEAPSYTGDLGSLKAYLLARLLWNPYMSQEEYEAHMDDFLEGYYGPGWRNVKEYLRLLHDATRHRHMGCFEKMDIGYRFREDYHPQAYQDVLEDSYLADFIQNHLDEAIRLWDDTVAQAADEGQRERAYRSRLAMTYLDLFCRKHDKETMTEAEQKAYEAAVEQFHKDKVRFGCHFNIWTAWRGR